MKLPDWRTGASASAKWCVLAASCALALAACGADTDRGAGDANAPKRGKSPAEAPAPVPDLVDPRPLQGAGAVAFDPARPRLAWAAGEEVRLSDLDNDGEARRLAIGSWVGDVGFAPDGAIWVIADAPQLWRDGALACRAEGVEADRLFAIDDAGAVVAGYTHSDGVGILRRQVWLDAQCGIVDENLAPMPEGITDSESDPGAPFGRATLQPVHPAAADLAERLSGVHLPAGAGVEQAVAVSPDGRWWVLEGAQGRTLWRRERP